MEHRATLSKAGLLKYYLVDESGAPVGKPFERRWQLEAYEATVAGDYQVITGMVGRPRVYAPGEYDRKRDATPERKAAKRDRMRKIREQLKVDASAS